MADIDRGEAAVREREYLADEPVLPRPRPFLTDKGDELAFRRPDAEERWIEVGDVDATALIDSQTLNAAELFGPGAIGAAQLSQWGNSNRRGRESRPPRLY